MANSVNHDQLAPQEQADLGFHCLLCLNIYGKYSVFTYEIRASRFNKNVNIFLSISLNICFGCSKEPSH